MRPTEASKPRVLLETEAFPFEHLSLIAEAESWRKEIHRPIYHVHKWWAKRLGSVFRSLVIGAFATPEDDLLSLFYEPTRFQNKTVFDPFMGSGTTIGEALKLGARGIGRDINPVAYLASRMGLTRHTRQKVLEEFAKIEADLATVLQNYYRTKSGQTVLYYFWVKTVSCPECKESVDLFRNYVFAKNAYPARKPLARVLCPDCGNINEARYDSKRVQCARCERFFDPRTGTCKGARAICTNCSTKFAILDAVRPYGHPPRHRLYAKLVLGADGRKRYESIDDHDLALFDKACAALSTSEWTPPDIKLLPGYNTKQAMNYGYHYWWQFFNERQLLSLSILSQRISRIESPDVRDLFACLFSGCLEFNNMFASYKGEGTGAVRHMFSHHILKPEKMPLEANVWGTPKSSGSFSTLFRSRILRALDYQENAHEVCVDRDRRKVYGLSAPLPHRASSCFEDFAQNDGRLYLSCGDSSKTDLPDGSVDVVITDPPFFDNVHYSQLADFFFVWQQRLVQHEQIETTRSNDEVQNSDSLVFAERLAAVWKECHRIICESGLLVFTYHHSRSEGWQAVLDSLVDAGFVVVEVHPIKAEMSVAAPKSQAKEPIDIDTIVVCRKQSSFRRSGERSAACALARRQVQRLNATGRRLSRNDVRVIVSSCFLKYLSWEWPTGKPRLSSCEAQIESTIDAIYDAQTCEKPEPEPQVATGL